MRKNISFFIVGVLAAVLCLTSFLFARVRLPLVPGGEIHKLTGVTLHTGDAYRETALPVVLKEMQPRTPVTLYAEIPAEQGGFLLLKSVFSPAVVYLNDVAVYEFGQEGSYPSFFHDPPTSLVILPLPKSEGAVSLRIEYLSPQQRSEISLPALYAGSEGALLAKLFHDNGFSLFFSLLLICMGLGMAAISVFFLRRVSGGSAFLWLGLFALAAGVWIFGECDLSLYFLPYPALLYAFDYVGMFCLTIPFLRFGQMTLRPANKLPLTVMLWVNITFTAAALLLQLLRVADLMSVVYWFQIIDVLALMVFAADFLWEHFRHRNPAAKQFMIGSVLMAIFAALEFLNYRLRWIDNFTVLFQIGFLCFLATLTIRSGQYVRESLNMAAEKKVLEYEMGAMSRQLALQHEQYTKLMEGGEQVKAMRHDLRHHLAAVGQLADSGNSAEIKPYLEKLRVTLADTQEKYYCQNHAVNAIAAHYLGLAEKREIAVEVKLHIPEDTGIVPAMDLCVILGNFLENALEACDRMEKESDRFIHVCSRIAGDTLSIVVANSFDGLWNERNGAYLSRKKENAAEGIGLTSVAAVCKKHRGLTSYEVTGEMWKSSALVHMEDAVAWEGDG